MTHQKRSVCFLSSGEMLRLKPLSHWVRRFQEFSLRSPSEIVLPALGFVGPFYPSKVQPFPRSYKATDLLPDWVKQARALLGPNGVVWASVLIDCGFLDNQAIWVRNQYDSTLDQVCIGNPVAQGVLKDLIDEVLALGVDGVILDITDIYPNSGSSAFLGISGFCFCDYCMEGFRRLDFLESKDAFVGDHGLLRLLLKVEQEGADHIDPPQAWIDQRDSGALVTHSIARKFVQGERGALESEANRLLKYFQARVVLTAESVRKILSGCVDANKRTAVVLSSSDADLSQMVTLQALDAAKSAGEYWLPDAPDRRKIPGDWSALQFLGTRSTYYINAFFKLVETARELVLMQGGSRFLERLLRTSKSLQSNKLAPGAAYVVDKLEQYQGFVGIPLGQEDHLAIVERLTRESTGQVLPEELLMAFRIANPDRQP